MQDSHMLPGSRPSHPFRLGRLILAAIFAAPLLLAPEAQAVPLPKDWCGRLWGIHIFKDASGVTTSQAIGWDNPTNGVSTTASPANVGAIPALPSPTTTSFAALGIHARSGTLYAFDRLSHTLYQYNMGTGGSAWTTTVLAQIPNIDTSPTATNAQVAATNFNKMTVTGDTLIIASSDSVQVYIYNLVPATGALVSSTGTASTFTFDGQTQLPNGTLGNPPGTTNINGGDVAQDEYGDTYMLTYDNADSTISPQYAYFYKRVGTQWVYKDRVQKTTNTDQFAGLAFYADTIYAKGTAGTLFKLPLTRLANDYDWAGNAGTLITVGNGTGVTDLASCGVPAIDVVKTQTIYTDPTATTLTPDQSRIGTGQYIKYTIKGTNFGDAWARNAYLNDTLPAGVTYVPNSATVNGTNINAATYPFVSAAATSAGSPIGEIRLPYLGNSNVVTFTFVVKVDGTVSTVQNQAMIGYANPYPSDPPNCATGLNCGTSSLATLYPSIFGTVWNDTNGSAAGTFSNIFTTGEVGTNTGTSNAMYALLINSGGNIIKSQPIASNGTYAFQALDANQNNLTIRLSTSAGTIGSAAPTAAIPTGWKATSPKATPTFNLITADILNDDFGISLPANTLLVKRITAINGQATNPRDGTNLGAIINSSATTNDDPTRKWPANYLKGVVNAGSIFPGDTIEYTIYYLNDSGADTKGLKICDPIRGKQTYVPGSMKLLSGGASTAISLTDSATDTTVDRANSYAAGAAPTNCNVGSTTVTGRDNGGVAIEITGTGASAQPDQLAIPAATVSGTPTSSYGLFRFTAKVDP